MRVLQLIDSLPLAGAEVLVKDIAPRLQERGIECEVAVLRKLNSALESMLERAGVPLHSTGVTNLYSPRQVGPLVNLMGHFDIVHVHLFPAQLWAVLAARKMETRIRLVTTEHNTWNARRRLWLRPLDRWMYPHYQLIACNSEATADELVRWCPGIAEKIRVIPNGIPVEDFETAEPADLGLENQDGARLVFVGRFEPQKDHRTILLALKNLPEVRLLLVGDGPLRRELEDLAQSINVRSRVSFLGRRTDVANVLKASDIYVHSTNSDGFGIAACEAMAAGLPVIASDVPGLADVVRGAGVLFPVGDHAALAREIQELLASPARRREMSKASRKRAQSFSIDKTVDGYLAMYESLCRQERQSAGVMP
ncbi:MAG: glycosyltransferase family 4 protein [Terracidiphilus sp.]|jgi:glycosyltransferase involved in cell wall biosynthesis